MSSDVPILQNVFVLLINAMVPMTARTIPMKEIALSKVSEIVLEHIPFRIMKTY